MYWIGAAIKWWALEVLICHMSSYTHNKSQQNYEKMGFYPFNGVAMWEEKYALKLSHKNSSFAFLCKKNEKRFVESPDER